MKCRHAFRSASRPPTHRLMRLALLAVLLVSMLGSGAGRVDARAPAAEGGSGRRSIEQKYGPVHYWLLRSWSDQVIECELFLEDDGPPDEEDIRLACGDQVVLKWSETPACKDSGNEKKNSSCEGLYLVYLGKRDRSYEAVEQLPPLEAHYTLDNCANGEWCSQRPVLFFYGVEPLPDQKIQSIQVRVGTRKMSCASAIGCSIQVPTTTERGTWLEYWVKSSYGDESEHQRLYLRNVYRFGNPSRYYLEVLSAGYTSDAAELQWRAFPALDHPDADFYSSRNAAGSLRSENHLYYLSGRLITTGEVDAGDCEGGVLLSNGSAGACGESAAYDTVVDWQNQYDDPILAASRAYGLPGRVLKGILAQESQFWADPQIPFEYGFGSLTENGVDALLTVDSASFLEVCLPALGAQDCASGYAALGAKQRAQLRGLALRAVGSEAEIDLIARVLMAQVIQVGQIVADVSDDIPGQAASYEDLWDLTIASYHAGAGCINKGLTALQNNDQPLTFERYCDVASPGCQSGCTFTQKVKDYANGQAPLDAAGAEN